MEEKQAFFFKMCFSSCTWDASHNVCTWDQFLCSLSVLENSLCATSASSWSLTRTEVKFLLERGDLSEFVLTVLLYCVGSCPWIVEGFALAKLLGFSFNEQKMF